MPTKKKITTRRKKAPIDEVEAQIENVEQVTNEDPATESVMGEALAAIQAESEDIQSRVQDEAEPVAEAPKSKRKPARKRSSRSQGRSKKPAKVSMDSVAMARGAEESEEKAEEITLERPAYTPTFAERIEEMRDIKPKQTADATFLIPDKFSFDLTDKHNKRKQRSWVKKTAYVLGGVIILLAVVLVVLTVYSNRLLSQESNQASLVNSDTNSADAAAVSPTSAFKLGFANVSSDFKPLLAQAVQSGIKGAQPDSAAQSGLPVVTADTLFFKSSAQPLTNSVLDFLNSIGIKAQIQQNDSLPDDMVLYLTNPVKNPDLSMMTSAVYNASGKSGAAKALCAALLNYKVVSCQGLNNPTNQTGMTILYKDQKVIFVLKRTPEFSKATFQKAATDQVEDIKVVAGK